jgi:membrane protease YdiL (CAAX protease family)
MSSPLQRSKAALLEGSVRPWHVVFVLFVGWAVGIVAAGKLKSAFDPSIRTLAWLVLANGISNAIYLAYVVVVPEFRRSLRFLFARPALGVGTRDIAWALAVTIFWGFGLYRVAILLPVLTLRPDLFDFLRFADDVPPFDWRVLALLSLTASIISPIGEELLFRGYLMNLWIAKRGMWFGIVASSVVFGLFHGENALFAGIGGFVFALVYRKYQSLWPGIVLHATYNFLAPAWVLGWITAIKPRWDAANPSHWIVEFVLAILFFPAAWQFWRRFRPGGARR